MPPWGSKIETARTIPWLDYFYNFTSSILLKFFVLKFLISLYISLNNSFVDNCLNDINLGDVGSLPCVVITVHHETISLKIKYNSFLKQRGEFMFTISFWKLICSNAMFTERERDVSFWLVLRKSMFIINCCNNQRNFVIRPYDSFTFPDSYSDFCSNSFPWKGTASDQKSERDSWLNLCQTRKFSCVNAGGRPPAA